MFTGLIENVGKVRCISPAREGARLSVACDFDEYEVGESIAVNGVCLTVETYDMLGFTAMASCETLSRSNLGLLKLGSSVHMERALRLGDRLGGHIVTGHVDGTAEISRYVERGSGLSVTFRADGRLCRYIVEKGSVAVDGVSLTVNGVTGRGFEVMLIPHTQQVLMDGFVTLGRVVNIEVDILGKYVEKLSSCHCAETGDIERAPSSLTLEKLRDLGF